MSQGSVLYQKHDFLFHPIKDLTKNWNVDIASVLTDYIDEVSRMTFTFNEGQTSLNFAEASMLIQGTACVWSRKVEYLNALVYQTLDIITKNKQDKQTSTNENQETGKNDEFDDSEDKFIELNDLTACPRKYMTPQNSEDDVVLFPEMAIQLFDAPIDRGSLFYCDLGEVVNYYLDFWANRVSALPNGLKIIGNPFNTEKMSYPEFEKVISTAEENGDGNNDHADDIVDDIMNDDDSCHDTGDDIHHNDEGVEAFDEIIEEQVEERQLRQRRVSTTPELMSMVEESHIPTALLDEHCLCDVWTPKPMLAQSKKTIRIPNSLQSNPRKRKKEAPLIQISSITDFFKKMKVKGANYQESAIEIENKRLDKLWKALKLSHLQHCRKNGLEKEQRKFMEEREDIENNNDDVFHDNDDNNSDEDDFHDINDLVDNIGINAEKDNIEDLNDIIDPTGLSYEDRVLQYVQRYYKIANEQRIESQLSQRVKEWEKDITPYMEVQNKRPEFDIHKYGDEVISNFNDVGEQKLFRDVNSKEETWSICRRFAATLQLANDGNFLLQSDGDTTVSCVNSLSLKLLSNLRLRDRLAEYNHA